MKDFLEAIAKYLARYIANFVRIISRPREFAKQLPSTEDIVYIDAVTFFVISMIAVQFIRAPLFATRPEVAVILAKDITWKVIFFLIEATVLALIFKILSRKASMLSTIILSAYLFSIVNIAVHIGTLLLFSFPEGPTCLVERVESPSRGEYQPAVVVCDVMSQVDPDTLAGLLYSMKQILLALFILAVLGFGVWAVLAWRAYAELHAISDERAYVGLTIFIFLQPILLAVGVLLFIQSGII